MRTSRTWVGFILGAVCTCGLAVHVAARARGGAWDAAVAGGFVAVLAVVCAWAVARTEAV